MRKSFSRICLSVVSSLAKPDASRVFKSLGRAAK